MFVYFVRSGRNGPIKIGVAKNVENRMDTLQTGNPTELILIAKVKCKSKAHAYSLETQLHKIYSRKRIRREWFSSELNLSHANRLISARDLEEENESQHAEQELDMCALLSSPI